MLAFWSGVILLAYGTFPAVVGLWLFDRWRSGRRNRRGQCAACGTDWDSVGPGGRFLIHARLVCSGCAGRARRRMAWEFGVLGLGASVATGIAVAGADPALLILVPPTVFAGATYGAVRLMKRANRRAARRIAAGDVLLLDAGGPVQRHVAE